MSSFFSLIHRKTARFCCCERLLLDLFLLSLFCYLKWTSCVENAMDFYSEKSTERTVFVLFSRTAIQSLEFGFLFVCVFSSSGLCVCLCLLWWAWLRLDEDTNANLGL